MSLRYNIESRNHEMEFTDKIIHIKYTIVYLSYNIRMYILSIDGVDKKSSEKKFKRRKKTSSWNRNLFWFKGKKKYNLYAINVTRT